MTLRNGKEVEEPELVTPKDKNEERIEKEFEEEGIRSAKLEVIPASIIKVRFNSPPFPSRLEKLKKPDKKKEILEIFRKIEINIILLDAIKQVLKDATFLKDLYINRKRLKSDEKIVMWENVLAVIQRKLPPKYEDPYMFIIPCKIRSTLIKNAILNLGVSINVMPKFIYTSLNLEPLKETEIISQLTNGTNAYPDGLIENVLVKKIFEIDGRDELEIDLTKHFELDTTHDMELSDDLKHVVETL
ncbi:uncharacterized protein [Coffea arabica]|uniref:Uncharacterized protein n=1 Tax=Coffea arabica TaxID=13443 RepID=A0ABM4VH70_COFAR